MFRSAIIRHLFRQNHATIYLEGIAVGTATLALPPRRRSLFGEVR